jgi:hypothetical protein
MVMVLEVVAQAAKHQQFSVDSMQVTELLAERQELLAQQTLAVAVAAVSLAHRIFQQEPVVQEHASLGIGVKHGTLCKN